MQNLERTRFILKHPTGGRRVAMSLVGLVCMGLLFLLCAACGGEAVEPDPWALYRQAMRPSTARQLDQLGLVPVYEIQATLQPGGHRLVGFQTVRFPNTTEDRLPAIVFRLYPNMTRFGGRMSVQKVQVEGQEARYEYDVSDTALEVWLEAPLEPGQIAEISMAYALSIPSPGGDYVLFGQHEGWISLPYFYPILAARDAQGWFRHLAPSYADASTCGIGLYRVTLRAHPDLQVVAPGVVMSRTVEADGMAVWDLVSGPIREFVVVASPVLRAAEGQVGDVWVRSWHLPGDEEAGRAALGYAVAALRVYQDWFGPYPFPELSVVEAPLGYRGMEFPTMSLIGVDLYRGRREELEYLVAHEVAHQWWYNQVGNDQVRFPWLDEGLAEYSTYLYFDQVYGPGVAEALRQRRWVTPYQYLVSEGEDVAVNQPAFNLAGKYEAIVYGKAALFFHRLRQEMGDARFRAALQEYLARYRYDQATPERLLATVNDQADQDLTALYNQWIRAVGASPSP